MELLGKVAIVTGSTRGIGRAIALDLATNGADVAFTYRQRSDLADDLTVTIRGLGRRALGIQADVSEQFVSAESEAERLLPGI